MPNLRFATVRLPLATMLTLAAFVARPAGAATLNFYNGTIVNVGTDTACLSEPPIIEIREQAYDGFSVRNNFYFPAVGEIWYAHVVISHPGNPCSGGSYTGIEISRPPNTAYAIDTNNPVFCAIRNASNQVNIYYRQDQGCPQAPSTGDADGDAFWAYSGSTPQAWPISTGTYLELMIPLRSNAPLTAQTLRFRINPDLGVYGYAQVLVNVPGEILFRTDFENDVIVPDVCLISGTVSCNLVQ